MLNRKKRVLRHAHFVTKVIGLMCPTRFVSSFGALIFIKIHAFFYLEGVAYASPPYPTYRSLMIDVFLILIQVETI